MGDVDKETATKIATEYADEECIGEFGKILDTFRENNAWIVEFRTHTFDDSYDHQVKISASVGNILSHDRKDRLN
jgi:UDP-N-acetylglucosamine transferase subunit ALG13